LSRGVRMRTDASCRRTSFVSGPDNMSGCRARPARWPEVARPATRRSAREGGGDEGARPWRAWYNGKTSGRKGGHKDGWCQQCVESGMSRRTHQFLRSEALRRRSCLDRWSQSVAAPGGARRPCSLQFKCARWNSRGTIEFDYTSGTSEFESPRCDSRFLTSW
jgi:hypothetical protein